MFNQSPIIGHFDGFQLFTVIHSVVIKFLVYIYLNELFIQKRGGSVRMGDESSERAGQGAQPLLGEDQGSWEPAGPPKAHQLFGIRAELPYFKTLHN